MPEAEGKPGAEQSRNSHGMHFPLTSATLTKCMHSQTSPPCWHMHTSRINRPKAPPETETPPEHMLCNECNAGGVSESIQ